MTLISLTAASRGAIATLTWTCDGAAPPVARRRDHAQVVEPRAHPLAAHVDVRVAVVNRLHDPFEAERPDRDPVADGPRGPAEAPEGSEGGPTDRLAQLRLDALQRAARVRPRRPDVAGRHEPRPAGIAAARVFSASTTVSISRRASRSRSSIF